MKKFAMLAALFLVSAFCASAQYKVYYTVEEVGMEYPRYYSFQIDWNNKLFFVEGDKHNDGPIKNYKENGNSRSFDVYYDPSSGINEKLFSVNFTPDGGDMYTMILNMDGHKSTFKLSTTEPADEVDVSAEGAESIKDVINNKTKALKQAIGKGVTKGIESLKKKSK